MSLKVATYLIIDEQTGASGFDYDLAQKFARFIHAELDIRVYDNLDGLFEALANHEIDLMRTFEFLYISNVYICACVLLLTETSFRSAIFLPRVLFTLIFRSPAIHFCIDFLHFSFCDCFSSSSSFASKK